MEENQYTKARPFSIPEPGPAKTESERMAANSNPGEIARANMQALRR